METAALVAPVTALEFLQDQFLLAGEGPVLTVYSLQQCPKACAWLSVLQHHRIHGIRPRHPTAVIMPSSVTETSEQSTDELNSAAQPIFYDLAVFGGKSVRLVRLYVDFSDERHLRFEILGPLMELHDWALDVHWLSGDKCSWLCVAVAHNSVLLLDVIRGHALVQRSCLEGCLLYSALLLVHESWTDTVLVGGTVFNQLVVWKPGGGDEKSELKAPVERRLLGHSGVIFSISYLQEKGWLASASDDRSVRVWGVGALGGPGGECGDLNPSCLRVLYGHQARVFSVRLSPGKVFSAGEDGACLVWGWAGGGKVVRTLKGHKAGGVRALAVSEGMENKERWVATGGADGGVRLWRVENEEKNETTEDTVTEKLSDLKFTGHGLPKVVCTAGGEDKYARWTGSTFVVCTDQGLVYKHSNGKWEIVWKGTPEFQSYCVMESVSVSVKDSEAKVSLCAVGNLTGSVQVFPISQPQSGILLTGGSGKIHSLIWKEAKENLYLLASGAGGLVHRWCIKVELDDSCFINVSVNPLCPFLLPLCAKRWLTAAVLLHSTSQGLLWVCGDRRGSLLLFQEEVKLEQKLEDNGKMAENLLTDRKQTVKKEEVAEGKDHTGLGVMKEEEQHCKDAKEPTLQSLSCLFGVHGKQGVTSLCEHQGLLYSTGRDGCVRVFRVHPSPPGKPEERGLENNAENKGSLKLKVLRVQRACKGMEWLERVLFLECDNAVKEQEEEEPLGGFENHKREEEMTENRGREARFVIVGFHAVQFVVWDPVRQEKLLAVPCGGGHRSWSLWPPNMGVWPGYGVLVFIKQGAVLASQPPGEELSQAGDAGRTGGWVRREGVHGRGIGCVCRLGKINGSKNEMQTKRDEHLMEMDRRQRNEMRYWEIVVTGGEDTSLTVLAINPNSGSTKVLSVITDHISSVRTITAITGPEGESKKRTQSLSALLVSAGGRAQMQCYRLLISWDEQRLAPSCQVIQVASHRLDDQWERRRNRHKTVKMDPETRYMCVRVVDETPDCVLLAVACSDGALRLFSISEARHQFDLLWETFYHQRCVLSITTCSLEDEKGFRCNLLFSAATDGKIVVWDLTAASFSSNDTSSSTPTPPVPCLIIPAHQSGVNSLAVWKEELGQDGGCCLVTVASGGDDGQLTVSTIRVQYPEEGKTGGSRGFTKIFQPPASQQAQALTPNQIYLELHSQFNIPFAHAAPLTDLKLLSPALLVSTSSDQRVCLWKVSSNGISHKGAMCSHVADAAGLSVWEREMIEEEGEDDKRKTRSEPKLETADTRQKGSPTQSKLMLKTRGRFNVGYEETADEARGGEPADVVRDPSNKVSTTSDETQSKKMGWVLVCGQGFQLLRVRNTEMWTARGEMEKQKDHYRVKVTLQEKSA
ncbi:WD repeat-containing protein 6 [Xyrichtys novacula]|uniref:tRNA (34-2'-O)-methyltransferase regulator WDR6 n=1 Tax=Xyrichtys novacula TaxID=13765 RepID=A0AAV1F2P2_XYRNO|nr:WD repeat-containing protein 6 [Xyrichtys novacula]